MNYKFSRCHLTGTAILDTAPFKPAISSKPSYLALILVNKSDPGSERMDCEVFGDSHKEPIVFGLYLISTHQSVHSPDPLYCILRIY